MFAPETICRGRYAPFRQRLRFQTGVDYLQERRSLQIHLANATAKLLTYRVSCHMIFYMKRRLLLLIASLCSFAAGGVVAATATTTFTVTASVSANCTITATGISFPYDPSGATAAAAASATGTVTIACTKGSG